MTIDIDRIRGELAETGYAHLPPDLSADYQSELEALGPLLPQYNGQLVRDIRPDPAISNDRYSPSNSATMTPHTEWYEFPGLPPRYVALWCVHQAVGEGGETTLADGYELIGHFPVAEREQLSSRRYQWRSRPAGEGEGSISATHPLVEEHPGGPIVRFSAHDLQTGDGLAETYVSTGLEFFKREHFAVNIEPAAALVWDNWRMLHARNAFDDPRRHLRRVLIGAARPD